MLTKLLRKSKSLIQYFNGRPDKKRILFIVGCQRSGTSMLNNVFEKDWNSKVYGEFSVLTIKEKNKRRIRLKSLDKVKKIIDKDRAGLIILKPLVETQNILKLLTYFVDSKSIWLFRNYRDVASSNLKKFGNQNGIENLKPIILNDQKNWRSENLSSELRELVKDHYSEDMSPYDAAALFWYVRNSLFFTQELDKNSRIFMCRYDDLVSDPDSSLKKIYSFAETNFPTNGITKGVKISSIGKGKDIKLNKSIDDLCAGLMNKMNILYREKTESIANWTLQ